ncbi:MAG TPA: hypothetical protein VE687_02635, partial [Stellaceae bacterium]|nr:hypothetical protein [Stellaceae bacterium]
NRSGAASNAVSQAKCSRSIVSIMLAYAVMPVATVPHIEGRISASANNKRVTAKMDPAIGKIPSQSRDTLHRGFVGM